MSEPRLSEAELMAQLAQLADIDPTAIAMFEQLATAVLPAGGGDRAQLTWPERLDGALDRGAGSRPIAGISTEERLRNAEARFRTLVEQIPAVTFMAVLGEGQNEVYISPHIEQLLGYTQEEWLANPFLWYWRLHPDDRVMWNEEFGRGCRTGGPFRAECRFMARDGSIKWVHGEARIIKDALGRPQFLQGVAFDITESKRAQEVLLNEAVRSARIEEEIAIARRVQTSLLPKNPRLANLEIAAAMVPASEVGGDYYDVLAAQDGGGWLAIGDVSGHGLRAGLVMLMVQSAMAATATARPDAPPSEVFAVINRVLLDNIRTRLEHRDFVTLTLLRWFADGRLLFAGAHQDLLVHRRALGRVEEIHTPGTWLGTSAEVQSVTRDRELRLEPGDTLMLITDGLTEAMNGAGEMFGLDRVSAVLAEQAAAPVEQIRDRLLGRVQEWAAVQDDDRSVVVARFTPDGRRES
jgi:PAS domain S-box-containing protein